VLFMLFGGLFLFRKFIFRIKGSYAMMDINAMKLMKTDVLKLKSEYD